MILFLKMSNSESFTQDIGSNQPLNDILEDIEVEELGLKGEEEEEGMAPPASKKRKHAVRSGIWKIFDKVFEDSIQKGKWKLCGTCIAADSKHNGTSTIYTIRSDCVKMFLEERELLKVIFSRPGMSREWRLHKKIISFFDITSHKGDDIAKVCVALVVEDGMKQMGMAVVRVREVVKWIKSSSARSNAFKDIAKLALPYELAIKLFSNVNPQFGRDLRNLKHNDLTVGVPGEEDWIEVRKVCSFLQFFYVMTRLVSGTMYATSHSFLMEMCDIFLIIKLLEDGEDAEVSYMAKKMMEKLGKYWLEEYELNPNMNKILYIAAMLVPRQKMKHVEFCLKKLYGDARANELAEELRKSIFDLFELYKKEFTPVEEDDDKGEAQSSLVTSQRSNTRQVNMSILTFLYGGRHAHGGRVLSTFRNSLAPEMVEAFICSEDWLRSSSTVEALYKDGKLTWPLDGAEFGELERTHSSDHDES
ncbi:hypothetical protein SASPL_104645 [Salvia splendens]|uniref:hAT-like transposase RNase-H fold domain-containing protein n=1 Tax=Salvia splendens TaxID=180675 RepID=A0A8X8YN66_SALSN|nr:hypothetical protein SASPL_104645 [Salvia splendens]